MNKRRKKKKLPEEGYIVPPGTEQETGLTQGDTDNRISPKVKTVKAPQIIPPGTEQETGLTRKEKARE